MNKKIKWGIAGLGNIAKKFASDLNLVPEAQLVAVASSDIHRAEIFKKCKLLLGLEKNISMNFTKLD